MASEQHLNRRKLLFVHYLNSGTKTFTILCTLLAFLFQMQSTGGATVDCQNNFINPKELDGDGSDEEQNQQEGGDPTVSIGTGRRKKRNTVKRILRNKRQETPTEQDLTEDRVLVSTG